MVEAEVLALSGLPLLLPDWDVSSHHDLCLHAHVVSYVVFVRTARYHLILSLPHYPDYQDHLLHHHLRTQCLIQILHIINNDKAV